MTCIIGIESTSGAYMGCDSAAVSGYDIDTVARPKVFILDEFMIGYTSSFRMGQLLQYQFHPPENDLWDEMKYMVSKFIPAIRDCLRDGGYTKIENNQEEGGDFLVAYRGAIYRVCSDFQVLRSRRGYCAVGCGFSYALGAIESIKANSLNLSVEQIILNSLEISSEFSSGVRGPFMCFTHPSNMAK